MTRKASKGKQAKNASSAAYLLDKYRVVEAQLQINDFLAEFPSQVQYLVKHILISYLITSDQEFVPISWAFLKDHLPEAVGCLPRLEEAGIVILRNFAESDEDTPKTYSKALGLSRQVKPADWLLDVFIQLGDLSPEERISQSKYNLFTGKKTQLTLKHQKYDENNHLQPELVVKAMDMINECYFNLKAIERHVSSLREAFIQAEQAYGRESAQYQSARSRYYGDKVCFDSMLDSNPIEIGDGIWMYRPYYKVQMSGRISHIMGGMQNASRRMKMAAYEGIANLKNYDLKASQVVGLIQQFEEANLYGGLNLSPSWLCQYRDDAQFKSDLASQIGISEDSFKKCLCALIYNSWLPDTQAPKQAQKAKNKLQGMALDYQGKSILDYLFEAANADTQLAFDYLTRFNNAVSSLDQSLDEWKTWLYDTYSIKMSYPAKNGDRFLKNPTGKTLNVSLLKTQHSRIKATGKLIAFILQGQEAAFIHYLTLLSLKYNYQVISNEHDGVVTIGQIPQEAAIEASTLSGLKYAHLVEKPWLTASELAELIAV